MSGPAGGKTCPRAMKHLLRASFALVRRTCPARPGCPASKGGKVQECKGERVVTSGSPDVNRFGVWRLSYQRFNLRPTGSTLGQPGLHIRQFGRVEHLKSVDSFARLEEHQAGGESVDVVFAADRSDFTLGEEAG